MYIVIKPRTRYVRSEHFGTLDAVVAPHKTYLRDTDEYKMFDSWMPFDTFEDAYDYWRDELALDCRYFIFEWVGWEGGRLTDK